jgi:ABC-type sugar transport system ATPase subunit
MDLSPSARAMIAIARAVILESSILILDEPTASLSLTETNHLFGVLKKLKERGTAILYVSHRLQEILEIADRITILRDGKLIATIPAQGTTVDHIIELMIGRSLKQLYPDRTSNFGEPLLEVEDLSGPGVNNLSFTLHRGEILGVGGLGGSGRSELLKLLVGATQRSSGTVTLGGKAFHPTHPADAFAVGMPLVPEERRAEGLILPLTVGENLVLSHLSHLAYGGLVMRGPKEKSLVKRLIKMLGVKTSGGGQPITELSGGNQQKVVFGKCLASEDVSVLMLDEPTRGVDVGSKAEIYDIVRKVADEGKGVLLVSSDLPELLGLSDRVLLLARDRTAKVFPASELDERTYLNYCMGGASE